MSKILELKDRVKHLMEIGGYNFSSLASKIGSNRQSVKNVVEGVNKPGYDFLQSLIIAFPNLSFDWLMTGEEPVFKEESSGTHSLQILPITVDDHGEENIVMVDTKAQGGYPTHYLEPEYYKQLPTIKFPSARFRNGTFRAFEVNGDSMSPTLHHGSVVFSRYEDNWEKGNIQEGYIYVVVTNEVVVVKRVLNRVERGELYLMSDNEGYEGFPVNTEDVRQLWRVVGGMVFKFPNTRYEWRRKMSHMEADIYELRRQVDSLQKLISK